MVRQSEIPNGFLEGVNFHPAPTSVTAGAKGAAEVIIDMVQTPDGKWVPRDPSDPNFQYTPKPEDRTPPDTRPSIPNPNQEDPWQAWQAGESERIHWYNQFNQQANAAFEHFQQTGNLPPAFYATRERTSQENQDEYELQKIKEQGRTCAALIYSPEGRQEVARIRADLDAVVDTTTLPPTLRPMPPKPKPGDPMDQQSTYRLTFSHNNTLIKAYEETKSARLEQILHGAEMTQAEKLAYLSRVSGISHTQIRIEDPRMVRLLVYLDSKRITIGAAYRYQMTEHLPIGQRSQPVPYTRLRDYGLSIQTRQERFALGWSEVKNQYRENG